MLQTILLAVATVIICASLRVYLIYREVKKDNRRFPNG